MTSDSNFSLDPIEHLLEEMKQLPFADLLDVLALSNTSNANSTDNINNANHTNNANNANGISEESPLVVGRRL